MVAKNDTTGDDIRSKGYSQAYLNNYDLIFTKNKKVEDNSGTSKNEYQDVLTTEECLNEEASSRSSDN